jgi:hypothetical protein
MIKDKPSLLRRGRTAIETMFRRPPASTPHEVGLPSSELQEHLADTNRRFGKALRRLAK